MKINAAPIKIHEKKFVNGDRTRMGDMENAR